jgi:hypothetical protein
VHARGLHETVMVGHWTEKNLRYIDTDTACFNIDRVSGLRCMS